MTDVSILICTRYRASQLEETLVSLSVAIERAAGTLVEVVLVDNGSKDHTQAVINSWSTSVSFPVQNVLEHKPGLSIARNAGLAKATGIVIVFTDDDCTLNPEYLVALARHYATDAAPVMRGGMVELGNPEDMPFTIKLNTKPESMNDVHFPGGFLLGCNMAITREIINTVGLFDERFGAGAVFISAEDTDYILRVYRAGYIVEYVPDMVVTHHHGRKTKESIIALDKGYNVGNGALYAKHCCDLRLLKHLYWDCRKWITGQPHHEEVGLFYGAVMLGNIKGAILYLIDSLRSGSFGRDR